MNRARLAEAGTVPTPTASLPMTGGDTTATRPEGDLESASPEVEALVFTCLERIEAEGSADVEDICSDHPEHAPRVRRALEQLRRSGLQRDETAAATDLPRQLGDFRLLREIGVGGMGVVYLAQQLSLDRLVALKVVRADLRGVDEGVLRFEREAAVVARLQHPGIVPIHAVGTDDGVAHYAMELVPGCSLQAAVSALRERHPADLDSDTLFAEVSRRTAAILGDVEAAPPSHAGASWTETCVHLAFQAAEALVHAHARGVVHRDVKPSNLLITPDGRLFLTDFGLALTEDATRLTRSHALLGSAPYMSPEQIRGETDRIDARTDLFSLGVVLHELLTLRPAFAAATRETLFRAILEDEPADPRTRNPAVTRDLIAILQTATEKDVERRYRSAELLRDDLAALLAGRPVSTKPISFFGRTLRWARRHRPLAALVLVLAILVPALAGLGGYVVAKWPEIQAAQQQRDHDRFESALQEGFLQVGEGRGPPALRHFVALHARHPERPEVLAGLALSHLMLDDAPAAIAVLDRAADVVAGNTGLLRLRADALDSVGDPDAAAAVRDRLPPPRTDLDHYVVGLRESLLGELGDEAAFRRALEAFTRAALLAEHVRPLYLYSRAHAAGRCRDADAAHQCVDVLTSRWPNSPRTWFWSGFALAGIDVEASIGAYRRALEMKPLDPVTWSNLGHMLHVAGDELGSIHAQRRAIEIDPDYAAAWHKLGAPLIALGRFDEAVDSQNRCLSLDADHEAAWFELADCYDAQGMRETAMECYRKAIDIAPDTALTCQYVGILRYYERDLEGAVAAFEDSLGRGLDAPATWFNLGLAYCDLGRTDDALAAFRKGPADDPRVFHRIGVLLTEHRRHAEAAEAFAEVTRLSPDSPEAWSDLGLAHRRLAHYDQALDAFERALAFLPDVPPDALPVEDWITVTRLERSLWREMDAILTGVSPFPSAEDVVPYVDLARSRGRNHAAYRLYARALSLHPELVADPTRRHRFHAACAAVRATADGTPDPSLGAPPADWRETALADARGWLDAQLDAWRDAVAEGNVREARVVSVLEQWLDEVDLQPARQTALHGEETAPWIELWRRVEALLGELE